ncbi:anhydro-N-acetylmuramic acid kinase [bacterium]|nr:anhydro-N-acetylmuramic acid kinase [bacterium]
MKRYDVIGVMSGTSLDGLDLLRVAFTCENGQWRYVFLRAETLPYPEVWRSRLAGAVNMSGLQLAQLHVDYGHFVGKALRRFAAMPLAGTASGAGSQSLPAAPDFAAVHGHTVFHQPENGLTLQIGDGAAMAAESGLTIVNNFRTTDVALGGQGAPLVPIGDELLFGNYTFCLNLGGIANISYRDAKGAREAFDISVCNMALNYYASRAGLSYDEDGRLARKGTLVPSLLEELEALPYYAQKPPKSLGFENFKDEFLPIVKPYENSSTEDILHTLVEHIARRIGQVCREARDFRPAAPDGGGSAACVDASMLMTGGGALNTYLAERIAAWSGLTLAPVDKTLIAYKEALIFALLGVLRMEGRPNCLKSVTGARHDNIGGAIYLI